MQENLVKLKKLAPFSCPVMDKRPFVFKAKVSKSQLKCSVYTNVLVQMHANVIKKTQVFSGFGCLWVRKGFMYLVIYIIETCNLIIEYLD